MRSLILIAAGVALVLLVWQLNSRPEDPLSDSRAAVRPEPESPVSEDLEGGASTEAADPGSAGSEGERREVLDHAESFHVSVIVEGYGSPEELLESLRIRADAFLFSVEGEPRVLDHRSGEVRLPPAAPALLSLHIHHVELRRHPWDGQAGELVWRLNPDELLTRFAGVRVHFQSAGGELDEGTLSAHYLGQHQELSLPDSHTLELFGFEPGWNRLSAEFPGGATWLADPILEPGGWHDFGTVLIDEPRSIAGRVLGEPRAGRLIELVEATGSPTGWDLGRKWRTQSDEEGRFHFEGLPPRTWVLRVANRKGYKKFDLFGPGDAPAWTRNGPEYGYGHDDDNPEPPRMLTHWDAYGFEAEPESQDVLIDTRGGSMADVHLELLPLLEWKVVSGGDEAQVYEWTVRDEQGVFVAAFRSVTNEEISLRTWPGTFKVEVKRLEVTESRTVTVTIEGEGQTQRVEAP